MKRKIIIIIVGCTALLLSMRLTHSAALGPQNHAALPETRIYAYKEWQSVGKRVNPDDLLTIEAAGTWLYTPDEYHGPEGHPRYPAPFFYPLSGPSGPLSSVPGGILIGRIGETGEPFVVGAGTRRRADHAGTIYLRINDDILSDNDGYVVVDVNVISSAEQEAGE